MQRFTSTPDAMKRALGSLPTGVTVISFADDEDRPVGMTANAVCSVSLTPPLVLACLNRSSRAWAMIERRGRFGINILGEGQRAIAEHCARPGQDKRLDPRWLERGLEPGTPAALAGALGYLDCAVDAAHPAGTHAIVVGRVRGILVEGGGGAPLAYFRGAYRQLDPSPESRAEAAWDLLARHGY
ncbi:MAG: flavin reductase family protein [Candidatus Rokubacteria bacterium]|nr:flavin reductase family protein [Candidatus Rokubacteria bacterium]